MVPGYADAADGSPSIVLYGTGQLDVELSGWSSFAAASNDASVGATKVLPAPEVNFAGDVGFTYVCSSAVLIWYRSASAMGVTAIMKRKPGDSRPMGTSF